MWAIVPVVRRRILVFAPQFQYLICATRRDNSGISSGEVDPVAIVPRRGNDNDLPALDVIKGLAKCVLRIRCAEVADSWIETEAVADYLRPGIA